MPAFGGCTDEQISNSGHVAEGEAVLVHVQLPLILVFILVCHRQPHKLVHDSPDKRLVPYETRGNGELKLVLSGRILGVRSQGFTALYRCW